MGKGSKYFLLPSFCCLELGVYEVFLLVLLLAALRRKTREIRGKISLKRLIFPLKTPPRCERSECREGNLKTLYSSNVRKLECFKGCLCIGIVPIDEFYQVTYILLGGLIIRNTYSSCQTMVNWISR